ncbi:related to alpha-galactosidase precursor [Rhynchosporium secalis]|uniref:Alpha-galactosidase n=1 Tax=Rhynchosporium secalis TaxID=38038 RepID=A0A1E1M1U0_RHYSE|nr:related to alpha-galactosidase precursor [Rhynchosporium secalis]
MYSYSLLAIVVSFLSTTAHSHAVEKRINNGLGKTPALGWNSWNAFGCRDASASATMIAANQFVTLGLKNLGYQYVNIDDCWHTMSRNSSGHLVADPTKWPKGIAPVVNQIHGMGLKFGLYGDAGTKTCAGYPGSQGHEVQDAQLLSSWGVDYWKYDNCYTPCNGQVPQTCWIPRDTKSWYTTFGNALKNVQHPVLYSMCSWGLDSVWTWGNTVGNSWRTTGDIANNWASVASIAAKGATISQYAAPGGFNDWDMMEIGNGVLTEAEERAHFGLWAIGKSPIILGTDLAKIKASSLAVIKNAGILAINQDSLGKAATYFVPSGEAKPVSGQLYPFWAGPLSDGVVVGIVAASGARTFNVNFKDVPGLGSGTFKWHEMYSGQTGTGTSVSISLPNHDMAVYKITS